MKLGINITLGPIPITALACPYTTGLGLPSTNSYGYWFQSRPSSSRIYPAPSSEILVRYTGCPPVQTPGLDL